MDISKWNVSSVADMTDMFTMSAFNHVLCGAAWVNSKAIGKGEMFEGSSGKIARTTCPIVVSTTTTTRFSPQSKTELEPAIIACLELAPAGNCSEGAHRQIGEWDVSAITDMSSIFSSTEAFNAAISKWDVSSVIDMGWMFFDTEAFNADISKWDVSAVKDMTSMFYISDAFNADISKWDVSSVMSMRWMFCNTEAFNADISKWNVSAVMDMTGMFSLSAFDQVLCGATVEQACSRE